MFLRSNVLDIVYHEVIESLLFTSVRAEPVNLREKGLA